MRYLRVQRNELPALFKITERVPAAFEADMPLEELWQVHDREMEKYRILKRELETEALRALAYPDASDKLNLLTEGFLELEKASPSLLDLKIAIVDRILESCHCCERRCEVNRKKGEKGFCRLTDVSRIASEFLHMGEEPELVPSHKQQTGRLVAKAIRPDAEEMRRTGHHPGPPGLAGPAGQRLFRSPG